MSFKPRPFTLRHVSSPQTQFYDSVNWYTREAGSLPFSEKLSAVYNVVVPEGFINGLPVEDLPRALLWHALYKPFWNENAGKGPGPSWSWASLSQRVGWPEFLERSGGDGAEMEGEERDVVCVEVEVKKLGEDKKKDGAEPEEEKRIMSQRHRRHDEKENEYAERLLLLGQPSTIILVGYFQRADFSLQSDTLRTGNLKSLTIHHTLSCVMDAGFEAREVWCLQVLKTRMLSGKWCTHFLVLEEVEDEERAATSTIEERVFRRVGTAKFSHRKVEAETFTAAQEMRVRLI